MSDSDFLIWMADRLVNVYDEWEGSFTVRRLRILALDIDEQDTATQN